MEKAGCLGRYAEEKGCTLELDSPYQTGDCIECSNFGCPNELNCSNCDEDCDYKV